MPGTRGAPWTVLANGAAGSAAAEVVAEVASILGATVVATSSVDELASVVRDSGEHRLAVAGGDGSVHAVVNALDRTGLLAQRQLAVIPMGTGNDLVRGLGLPLDPIETAEGLRAGVAVSRPSLRWNGGLVVNALHLGAGADASARADRWGKRLGPATYPVAALWDALTAEPRLVSLAIDDRELSVLVDALFVVVGATVGGGFRVRDEEVPADEPEVLLIPHLGRLRRFAAALTWARGGVASVDEVTALPLASHLHLVGVPPRRLCLSVDGELVDLDADESLEVRRGPRWTLVRPPG